jgi:hypothetical protein
MTTRLQWGAGWVAVIAAAAAPLLFAQVYKTPLSADHPAVRYSDPASHNPLHVLQGDVAAGRVAIASPAVSRAALSVLLDRLNISIDSQMLVFSKTSNQAAKISPDHPRTIFFNDAAVVAYVPGGATIELAALDGVRGTVFYTLASDAASAPRLERAQTCLRCHHGPNTEGVPGIYVGSVIPGPSGAPLRGDTAIITDHRTSFADRWGGWYVTARRGEQRDRANAVASNPSDPAALVRESQQNLTTLAGRFNPTPYLAATSDIVALMTFEHQTQMWNLLSRVTWQARIAEHASSADAARAQDELRADIEELVAYMLFAGEAPLKEPIEGVSSFARTFAERGRRDRQGRSLRDFDLKSRLFRYPLSYMIYSDAFDLLPATARNRVYQRLYEILTGVDTAATFAHVSARDRSAILGIVRDTKQNLPDAWRQGGSERP